MSDPNQAIKMCKWRKDIGGVSVCGGELAPCDIIIDDGKCDTLKKFYGQKTTYDKLRDVIVEMINKKEGDV